MEVSQEDPEEEEADYMEVEQIDVVQLEATQKEIDQDKTMKWEEASHDQQHFPLKEGE